MSKAVVYLPLTQVNLEGVKRALQARLPRQKSSHITEALAAALGQRTHAALLATLRASDPSEPAFVPLDEAAFAARLEELSGRRVPLPPKRGAGLFHGLEYPPGAEVIRTWSRGFDRVRYDAPRLRAWRNMMVAAINAGLEQRLFGVRAGDNRWPGAGQDYRQRHRYSFQVGGLTGVAAVRDGGFDELRIHSALWPTQDADRWIGTVGASSLIGEAWAAGWFERRTGAWLQVSRSSSEFHCRRPRLATVAALDVEPLHYADRGSFKL